MQPYTKQEDAPEDQGNGFRNLAIFAGVCVAFIMWCLYCSACSAEKRITRIAAKHPGSIVKPCNIFLPPIVSSDSTKTVFVPGAVINTTDTTVVYDTLTNTYYVTVNTLKRRVDTLIVTRNVTVVDQKPLELQKQATEKAVKERDAARISDAKKATKISILTWSLIILGAYTLGRWLCKYFFHISLP